MQCGKEGQSKVQRGHQVDMQMMRKAWWETMLYREEGAIKTISNR